MTQYTTAVLADPRPVQLGHDNSSPNYYYRWLRQILKVPVKFSWDRAAMTQSVAKGPYVTGMIDNICDDLVSTLNGTQGTYLKGPLKKVKEIHFTTTSKTDGSDIGNGLDGYYLSFNKTSGVLTAAISTKYGVSDIRSDGVFSNWITKNIR